MSKKFEYLRPGSTGEASELKGKYGVTAKYLAGGTDLILQWLHRQVDISHCIDLSFIPDLKYLKNTGEEIQIGAMATLSDLENANGDNSSLIATISDAAKLMCTPQLRNVATVGGNLCNASPAADLSVVFVALGASVKLLGSSGERVISLEQFFRGVNQTALEPDELLIEILVPIPSSRTEPTFNRLGRTVVDIAQVNAAVSLSVDSSGILDGVRIALGAVAPVPIRSGDAEKMLIGSKVSEVGIDLIEEASMQAASDAKPISDIRGSAEFRRYISRVLVRRSINASIMKLSGAQS